jgi:hypothetical protein
MKGMRRRGDSEDQRLPQQEASSRPRQKQAPPSPQSWPKRRHAALVARMGRRSTRGAARAAEIAALSHGGNRVGGSHASARAIGADRSLDRVTRALRFFHQM